MSRFYLLYNWKSIYNMMVIISKHCCCSLVAKLCLTLFDLMNYSTPGFLVLHYQSLLKLTSIELVIPSNHLILCCSLLLPSIFPSIRVFYNESALHISWPKYWSFSFSTSPSMNIQNWFHLGLTGLISLQSKGLSGVFSAPQLKSINSSVLNFL